MDEERRELCDERYRDLVRRITDQEEKGEKMENKLTWILGIGATTLITLIAVLGTIIAALVHG